jgi:hypothetical protein
VPSNPLLFPSTSRRGRPHTRSPPRRTDFKGQSEQPAYPCLLLLPLQAGRPDLPAQPALSFSAKQGTGPLT